MGDSVALNIDTAEWREFASSMTVDCDSEYAELEVDVESRSINGWAVYVNGLKQTRQELRDAGAFGHRGIWRVPFRQGRFEIRVSYRVSDAFILVQMTCSNMEGPMPKRFILRKGGG